MAPTWFIVIGSICLILYILYRVLFAGPLSELLNVIKGERSILGMIFMIIIGLFCGIITIWYIVDSLI